MYEVIIFDAWDGTQIVDEMCETEKQVNSWVRAFNGPDLCVRV